MIPALKPVGCNF